MLEHYDDEEQLAETYGLNDDQLAWRRWTIDNKCRGSLDKFRQEYPSNDVEAFLMSGRPAFGIESVRAQLAEAEMFEKKNKRSTPARSKSAALANEGLISHCVSPLASINSISACKG
jgi:hypothetical protein